MALFDVDSGVTVSISAARATEDGTDPCDYP
jgi:hypothetical protein